MTSTGLLLNALEVLADIVNKNNKLIRCIKTEKEETQLTLFTQKILFKSTNKFFKIYYLRVERI